MTKMLLIFILPFNGPIIVYVFTKQFLKRASSVPDRYLLFVCSAYMYIFKWLAKGIHVLPRSAGSVCKLRNGLYRCVRFC